MRHYRVEAKRIESNKKEEIKPSPYEQNPMKDLLLWVMSNANPFNATHAPLTSDFRPYPIMPYEDRCCKF